MNKLPMAKRAAIVRALTEGMAVRATARMMGVSKDTVLKLLVELGDFCSVYQYHRLRELNTTRIEVDEIWAFCGAKAKNAKQIGHGDIWTYTAIDAESKLMISWLVGERNADVATLFMRDLSERVQNQRVQLTTDGANMYIEGVRKGFGYGTVDFAQLAKTYGAAPEIGPARRYSPPICTGARKVRRQGKPDYDLVSTSYVERANLTMRMGMRRFTRLTNGFSKKAENHSHSVALHFMSYNFCRSHGTLTKAAKGVHTTPAMAAGLTNHVWTIEEVLGLMDGAVTVG